MIAKATKASDVKVGDLEARLALTGEAHSNRVRMRDLLWLGSGFRLTGEVHARNGPHADLVCDSEPNPESLRSTSTRIPTIAIVEGV